MFFSIQQFHMKLTAYHWKLHENILFRLNQLNGRSKYSSHGEEYRMW